MRLINLSKKGDVYVVKAEELHKVLGITLWSRTVEFQQKENEGKWYTPEGIKAGSKTSRILDKWLKDHLRFIG